jgi:hypothetical protein
VVCLRGGQGAIIRPASGAGPRVNRLKEFLSDRMQLVALLIVACFASVFVLTS